MFKKLIEILKQLNENRKIMKANMNSPMQWRDIPYYGGCYKVNDRGQIRSIERTVEHPHSKTYTLQDRVLKPSTENGYARVYLYYPDWERERVYVHKVVAEAFVQNPHDFKYVNHKDGNRLNNNVRNLEWREKRNSPR